MNGMSRQVDGPRSMADSESAQEYQDNEFSDELGMSDPAHPLFPASLFSNSATATCVEQPKLADRRMQQDD